jgi:hypothetical protein
MGLGLKIKIVQLRKRWYLLCHCLSMKCNGPIVFVL